MESFIVAQMPSEEARLGRSAATDRSFNDSFVISMFYEASLISSGARIGSKFIELGNIRNSRPFSGGTKHLQLQTPHLLPNLSSPSPLHPTIIIHSLISSHLSLPLQWPSSEKAKEKAVAAKVEKEKAVTMKNEEGKGFMQSSTRIFMDVKNRRRKSNAVVIDDGRPGMVPETVVTPMVVPIAKGMVTKGTLCIRDRSCSPDKGTNMQSSVASSEKIGSSSEDDDSTYDEEATRGRGRAFHGNLG
ncbi:hypothetical protein Droror1_Dr00014397 [Drosera rotundifolia]